MTEIQKYLSYNELNDFIKKMRKESGEEIIKGAIKTLKSEYPSLGVIVYRAYTPSFNDGEPCTLSTTVECIDIEYEEIFDEDSTVGGKTSEDFEDWEDWEEFRTEFFANVNSVINYNDENRITNRIDDLIDVFQAIADYDDFEFVITVDDLGQVTFTQSSYDCGY